MKKKILYPIVLSFTALVAFVSCKNDKEEETPQPNPALTAVISIAEPVAGTTYQSGEVVHINATVTADFHMHGYHAYLINLTADDTVWSTDAHEHGESYTIQGDWTNNVTAHSDMKLKITATLDHDGTIAEKEVAFHCHPM